MQVVISLQKNDPEKDSLLKLNEKSPLTQKLHCHVKVKRFQCMVIGCPFESDDKKELKRHQRANHAAKVVCEKCGETRPVTAMAAHQLSRDCVKKMARRTSIQQMSNFASLRGENVTLFNTLLNVEAIPSHLNETK